MKGVSKEFSTLYASTLDEYLAGAGEVALRKAYELGRQALEYESGMLVVTAAHHKALQSLLLHKTTRAEQARILAAAANFHSECLSPFEMAQRGFRDSIASLRTLNAALNRQQRDLRLLLSPMPNLLLTVDDHGRLAAFFVPPGFPHILKVCDVGLSLTHVLPDEIGARLMTVLRDVSQSGQVYRLEFAQVVDGQMRYFDLQISPVATSHDVLLVIDDVTERKAIEIAEHQQRVLAEALRNTAMALNSSFDLNEILDRIVTYIGQVVPHDTANIMLIDGGTICTVRTFGYKEHGMDELETAIAQMPLSPDQIPMLYQAVTSKQVVIVSDLVPFMEQHGHGDWGLTGSNISTPIMTADTVIGLLNLQSFIPNFFTALHAENLQIFAHQAAVAIENAQLFEQSQKMAALNERHRLARDLHDSVSQSLFAAGSLAESIITHWQRNPTKVFPLMLDLQQLLKNIKAEMRVLLWELRPANLVNTPLDNLLAQLVQAVQARTSMAIRCTAEATQPLPEDVHIAFYRITQEALNNIFKHSQATEVEIRLHSAGAQLALAIHDNGQGFSTAEIAAGFGLENMRERASLIGAHLDVSSTPGQGTTITVKWATNGNGQSRSVV